MLNLYYSLRFFIQLTTTVYLYIQSNKTVWTWLYNNNDVENVNLWKSLKFFHGSSPRNATKHNKRDPTEPISQMKHHHHNKRTRKKKTNQTIIKKKKNRSLIEMTKIVFLSCTTSKHDSQPMQWHDNDIHNLQYLCTLQLRFFLLLFMLPFF